MDVQALNGYIGREIRRVAYQDRVEVYLPFYFGEGDSEPLCLVWDKNKVLSDGGRTLAELKKRVGDVTPYNESIANILKTYGNVKLEGGQKLVVRDFQTVIDGDRTYKDYSGGLNKLMRVISIISVVDKIKVDEDGAVIVC